MIAYTGAVVERMFGKAVFDLAGIQHKARVPILLGHDTDAIVGHADSVKLTDKGMELEGTISEVTAEGKRVAALSDEGFPWEASVGLQVIKWEDLSEDQTSKVNGAELSGPLFIGRETRLMEVSFVTAGADKETEAVALEEETMKPKTEEMQTAALDAETISAVALKAEGKTREALGAFLDGFPGREGWAARKFAEGCTLTEAKAHLADVLQVELAAAHVATEEAGKASAIVAELASKTEQPGVGFSATDRQAGKVERDLSALPFEERAEAIWKSRPEIRGEFAQSKGAFMTIARREGLDQFTQAAKV